MPATLRDGDTWLHVAVGDWIIENLAIPHVDPFSFSFAGAPWTAHEWLAEAVFALAHRLAGWQGVSLVTGASAGAALYVMARRTARDLTASAVAVLALISTCLMAPCVLARPHLLALPVVAAWCDALLEARDANRAPPLAVAALMSLWANLHGSFAFGFALAGLFALEAVKDAARGRRLEAAKAWGLFGLASLAAALVSPLGVEGLLFPFRLVGLEQLSQIREWQAEDFTHPCVMELALLGLIGLAFSKPLRVAPLRLLLLIGLVHLSLAHIRHQMLLALIAPMLLARPLSESLDARAPNSAQARGRAIQVAELALALALVGARLATPLERGDSPSSPKTALAAIPAALRDRPMLNSYGFGGFLIYSHMRPFIDGRADMYGEAFMKLYGRILSGDPEALEDALKRYDTAWTIFAPNQPVTAVMDREPGWRRFYADPYAVVHVRGGTEVPAAGLRSQ